MRDEKQIEKWIKYAVPNLRYRWPTELKDYSDRAIACAYNDFYFSDMAGNNDERFPEFFSDLPNYEKEK